MEWSVCTWRQLNAARHSGPGDQPGSVFGALERFENAQSQGELTQVAAIDRAPSSDTDCSSAPRRSTVGTSNRRAPARIAVPCRHQSECRWFQQRCAHCVYRSGRERRTTCLRSKHIIVQRAVSGTSEQTIQFSARAGTLLAFYCLNYTFYDAGTRTPVRFQNGSKVRTALITCDAQHVLPALSRIVRHLRFTGVACMDFKTPDDGVVPMILELNPRVCGALRSLSDAAPAALANQRALQARPPVISQHALCYPCTSVAPDALCQDIFCGTVALFRALISCKRSLRAPQHGFDYASCGALNPAGILNRSSSAAEETVGPCDKMRRRHGLQDWIGDQE